MSIDIEKLADECDVILTAQIELFAAAIIEQCALACDSEAMRLCNACLDGYPEVVAGQCAISIRALKPPA